MASSGEIRLLHNRLAHSLKVGQIARRIAERLTHPHFSSSPLDDECTINPDVVETAGLSHDLGHPPFGHAAEAALDEQLTNKKKPDKDCGGFNGNAQTFRIVTRLSQYKADIPGLDLTAASLNAILKYPCLRKDPKSQPSEPWYVHKQIPKNKWGAYVSDSDDLNWARRSPYLTSGQPSPEAIIMDLADDIAYALHDIEDFHRAGLLPLYRLEQERDDFLRQAGVNFGKLCKHSETAASRAWDSLKTELVTISHPFSGSREDRWAIHNFTSERLTKYIEAVNLSPSPPFVTMAKETRYEIEYLKELTRHYVVATPSVQILESGQKALITELYTNLVEWVEQDVLHPRIPPPLRDAVDEDAHEAGATEALRIRRGTADYISSLTEVQAIDLHQRMSGATAASIFGTWF